MSDPAEEYERRLSARQREAHHYDRQYRQLGNFRLAFVALVAVVIWFAVARGASLPLLASLAIAAVVVTFIAGDRLTRRIQIARRGVAYYQAGLTRVRERRNERGATGEEYLEETHPYARDLDIFGKHSLFQLLSVCRTRAGEQKLAAWLRSPAPAAEVRSRQTAAGDLRERLDLREDLAALGEEFRAGGDPDALAKWAAAEHISIPRFLPYVAGFFSVFGLITLAAFTLTLFSEPRLRILLIIIGLLEAAIFFQWRRVVNHIAHSADMPGHSLILLSACMARLEQEQFTSERLRTLQATLRTPQSASVAIARLHRLMDLLESREHWLLRLVGPFVLWTTQLSMAVELWRQKHGSAIQRWLEAVADFEALNSLAAAAWEHPEDIQPEIGGHKSHFVVRNLAHPLLQNCVPNDVALDHQRRLLMVSGSNMSGKSTLLRTIGTNAVLAFAGACVRATSFSSTVFSLGASIYTVDSLEGGISRFYAELLRVRQILDLSAPALFLLDELLAGTNSYDRRIGAEAILRALLAQGAVGLATTHDLALASIALGGTGVQNVHFADSFLNGRLHFDYKLLPGVVEHSNALEIMRSVGLRV